MVLILGFIAKFAQILICPMTKGRGFEVCKKAKTSYEPPSTNIWTHKSKNDYKQQCQYWKIFQYDYCILSSKH